MQKQLVVGSDVIEHVRDRLQALVVGRDVRENLDQGPAFGVSAVDGASRGIPPAEFLSRRVRFSGRWIEGAVLRSSYAKHGVPTASAQHESGLRAEARRHSLIG